MNCNDEITNFNNMKWVTKCYALSPKQNYKLRKSSFYNISAKQFNTRIRINMHRESVYFLFRGKAKNPVTHFIKLK